MRGRGGGVVPGMDMHTHALFEPLELGDIELRNRVVMAPLTRLRADEEGVPTELMVEHYRQRASAGMIVTEGTFPVMEGRTWIGQPGIETAQQQEVWAKVADAVHASGGSIVMQIMHGGRISHPEISLSERVVGPSANAQPNLIRVPGGKAEPPVAHALSESEIGGIILGFARAARRAVDAGMDGVEIHGANGYLIHQFFSPETNWREDQYGGSPENRARLAVEIARAVAEEIGAGRTGIRLSPQHEVQGVTDPDPWETYGAFARGVAGLDLAFIDFLHHDPASDLIQGLRAQLGRPVVMNSGFNVVTTREEAFGIIGQNLAEAVGVGRPLIANPDLVERWRSGASENEPDASTFYLGGAKGYTDYPTL